MNQEKCKFVFESNCSVFFFQFIPSCILDLPDAPSKPEISNITERSATLTWSPPYSDGGAPIIGYTVEKKDKFGTRWTPVNKSPVQETTFVVSGLKEGEECQFRVIAENKAGQSEPSAATRAVRIKAQYGEMKNLFKFVSSIL